MWKKKSFKEITVFDEENGMKATIWKLGGPLGDAEVI